MYRGITTTVKSVSKSPKIRVDYMNQYICSTSHSLELFFSIHHFDLLQSQLVILDLLYRFLTYVIHVLFGLTRPIMCMIMKKIMKKNTYLARVPLP